MLTMKHICGDAEFVREIGSYVIYRHANGNITLRVWEGSGLGESDGCWGGRREGEGDDLCATVYIMNNSGSTVATYRWWVNPATIVDGPALVPTDELPADMQEPPLDLAA